LRNKTACYRLLVSKFHPRNFGVLAVCHHSAVSFKSFSTSRFCHCGQRRTSGIKGRENTKLLKLVFDHQISSFFTKVMQQKTVMKTQSWLLITSNNSPVQVALPITSANRCVHVIKCKHLTQRCPVFLSEGSQLFRTVVFNLGFASPRGVENHFWRSSE